MGRGWLEGGYRPISDEDDQRHAVAELVWTR